MEGRGIAEYAIAREHLFRVKQLRMQLRDSIEHDWNTHKTHTGICVLRPGIDGGLKVKTVRAAIHE